MSSIVNNLFPCQASVTLHEIHSLEQPIVYPWKKWNAAHCLYMWRLAVIAKDSLGDGGSIKVWANRKAFNTRHCNEVVAKQDYS